MIFLSILAKTFALALVSRYPWQALLCWAGGWVLDFLLVRRAASTAGLAKAVTNMVLLNVAALVMGWAALGACDYAAMRCKDGIPVLASFVGSLLSLMGLSVGSHGGMVYLTTMAGPLEFATSIDHLGLKAPLLFLVLSGVWLFWAEPSLPRVFRKLGMIAGLLLVLTILRTALWIMLFLGLCDFVGFETEELPFRPFMNENAAALSYLPFLLAAGALMSRCFANSSFADTRALGLPRVLRWLAVPALLLLSGIAVWEPTGSPKSNKKIVISTFHTQWSRTDRPYDREWYGADSGYNYACLKRLLGRFYPVAEAAGPLRPADLDGAGILIIYLPDRDFTKDEIELVHGFVRDGGGLWVIGDHTNVFGSTSHLNKLCEPFGFQYRDDVLFDLDEDFHQMLYPPPQASQLWHGVSMFKLRGPTSITPTSIFTRPVYQVDHSKGVRAIYSVNNFYPPPHDDPKMKMGTFCVSATSHYGRGRVTAWADSTVFSNFEIFYPGKYEYLLNTMHWLSHKDSSWSGMMRRLVPIIALAALAIFLMRRRDPRVWFATVVAAVACLGAARMAGLWIEQRRAEFPKPLQPSEWVVFAATAKDKGHHLQTFITEEPYDQRYEVFIQWVLRTGAYAGFQLLDKERANGFYEHLRAQDNTTTALALIVRKEGDLSQLDALAAVHTRAKDPLLLMFASTIPAAQAVDHIKRSGLVKSTEALAKIATAWPSGEVEIRDGDRRVLVISAAERFSDKSMGISEKVVPDAGQRVLFNQAFSVIERLLGRVATNEK